MKEHSIDCQKYRKSTHLAGIDVETIINEKGNCILTIKDAYYATGVDVSGNKTDGYFLEFTDGVKPMCVNSINRKTIAAIIKGIKKCTPAESRFLPNWIGQQIDLGFDDSVKMMGKIVGGIRVKPTQLIKEKKGINDANFEKALLSIQANTYSVEKLKADFLLTESQLNQLL